MWSTIFLNLVVIWHYCCCYHYFVFLLILLNCHLITFGKIYLYNVMVLLIYIVLILVYILTTVPQYYHNVLQQHCFLLFIYAIVQHIVRFGYMLDNSWTRKSLSPDYFSYFGKIYFIKICLCNGIVQVSDIVSILLSHSNCVTIMLLLYFCHIYHFFIHI